MPEGIGLVSQQKMTLPVIKVQLSELLCITATAIVETQKLALRSVS
jgi:hypothetical protein